MGALVELRVAFVDVGASARVAKQSEPVSTSAFVAAKGVGAEVVAGGGVGALVHIHAVVRRVVVAGAWLTCAKIGTQCIRAAHPVPADLGTVFTFVCSLVKTRFEQFEIR